MVRTSLVISALFFASSLFAADSPAAAAADKHIGQKVAAVQILGLDGKAASLGDLRGKAATVVVFVATECPVSNSYIPAVNDLAQRQKDVAVLVVAPTDEPAAAIAKWAKEFKVAVPVYLDPKKEAARALGAATTPEAAVLDAGGVLRYRGRIDDGYYARLKKNAEVSSHDLKNALDDVLAGKPVRVAVTKPIGCAIDLEPAPVAKADTVTYHKDVAAILQKHCQVCHRPGEIGPFALTNYRQAKRWAPDITAYTASRQMPPWMPGGGLAMRGERKMTDAEIATLAKWEEAGCPEGDPKDAPAAVTYDDGWRLGKPDLVLTVPDDFHLAATGDDIFRCFVIPTGLIEDKWVIGYDVRPGNPRVVHHTLNFFDRTGQARALEERQQLREKENPGPDRGPGYTVSMGVGFVAAPSDDGKPTFGGIGGWAPGSNPQFLPKGAGWLLPAGSDFIIQTHYHRDGKPNTDRTQVALYFAKEPVEKPWQTVIITGMKPTAKIPAGKSDYVSKGKVYLHSDAVLHSVLPHMHLLGKSVKVTMTPPGGEPVMLVDVPHWDYRWQEAYWFEKPIHARAGTKLEIEAIYDNSTANPNNPHSPPKDVTYGEQTTDEMLFAFFGATSPESPSQRIRRFGFPPAGLGAEVAPMKGELTPLLENRVGVWDNSVKLRPTIGKESSREVTDIVTKAFGGTFLLSHTSGQRASEELYELVTYDPGRKVYRMWTYNGQGSEIDWTGTYDEKAGEITWKAVFQPNVTSIRKWKLQGNDRMENTLEIRSGILPILTIDGNLTRKK